MPTFRTYMICRSLDGWSPIEIASTSRPEITYLVMVNPWGADSENICHCESYVHRGWCRHQAEASERVCRWTSQSSPDLDWLKNTCPRCGGATRMEIELA